ncbi:hypothetical protein QBC39DRAFT_266811 [Podospora conica]|nr:hypothetical protein QBC39DRAFT_266811 [Schizothecium conicum]
MSGPPPPYPTRSSSNIAAGPGRGPGDTPSHVLPVSGLLGSRADHGSSVEPNSDQPRTSGGKKRKTTAGTRGVANLTPDQLAKKRANDREAQRAIRERQKTRMEQYEREIAELKSQRSYQDLTVALQETAAAKAEADRLRGVLASVVGMIQPALQPLPPPEPPIPQPIPPPPAPPSYSGSTVASPGSVATPLQWPSSHHTPEAQPHVDPVLATLSQQHKNSQDLDFRVVLHSPHQIPPLQCGINGPQDNGKYRHIQDKKYDWTAYPSPSPSPIPTTPAGSPFEHLIRNCLLDHRQHLATGHPLPVVLGPRCPSVSSLVNPAHAGLSHPLSRVFTDIISRYDSGTTDTEPPQLRPLPERVAVLWIMFLLLRWEVSPTDANEALVPAWLRPVGAQMEIPHPSWINYLPWPRLRERLVHFWVENPQECKLDNFFLPFTATLSLNWPYEDVDALLRVPPPAGAGEDEGELLINPVFERHIGRLENWTVGDAFYDAFPQLGVTYNWKSERAGGRIVEYPPGGEHGGRKV